VVVVMVVGPAGPWSLHQAASGPALATGVDLLWPKRLSSSPKTMEAVQDLIIGCVRDLLAA
jgi:hypothetical protein